MSTSTIHVYETTEEAQAKEDRYARGKPDHWVDAKPGKFQNPWPSWYLHSVLDTSQALLNHARNLPRVPENITRLVQKPTFGLHGNEISDNQTKIKATWLGHACFLIELPARSVAGVQPLSRGARILFDPVFSDRCSPSQWVGPKRYTPPPCDIEHIPEFDAIVISHNHYDHLDTHTIRTLFRRARIPHVFAPLGNAAYFISLGIPETHTHIMDWWESRRVEVDVSTNNADAGKEIQKVVFDVTCTPAQHFTGRAVFDQFKSLWASWAISEVSHSQSSTAVKVYFAGDTGYRAVRDGQDENEVPTCPAFKEIGERFGGFDFAMIPIGAYHPRDYMSPIHCAPQDSVRIFNDIRAKRALGMHWGTWILTSENVDEPPKRLAEECQKIGIEKGLFSVCDIGETLFI